MSQQQQRSGNRNDQQQQRGNGRSGPQTNQPDIRIEAMVEKSDGNGGTKTAWIPIGAAWKTENGDYTGELRSEPTEWKHTAERRIFLRMRQSDEG